MYSYLNNIIDDINLQIESDIKLPILHRFSIELKYLDAEEKLYIRDKIYKAEWNIGSIYIFNILQCEGLVTMSNYILRQADSETVHLILNDLLETEFNLLANLIMNYGQDNFNSVTISNILEEFFRRLTIDIIQTDYNYTNYFQSLKDYMPNYYLHLLSDIHLKIVLGLNSSNYKNAFTNQFDWQKDYHEMNTSIQKLFTDISINSNKIIDTLIKSILLEDFCGWKYLLIFLKIIHIENIILECDIIKIKNLIKELYKSCIEKHCDHHFFIVLILIRELCKFSPKSYGTYSQWYKYNISEIKYKYSDENFKYVLKMLQDVVSLENDEQILLVHLNTSISAPIHCNKLVIDFKNLIRSKLDTIKNIESNEENLNNLVID